MLNKYIYDKLRNMSQWMRDRYPYDDPKPSTGSGPSGVAVGQTAEDHDVTLSRTNEVYYIITVFMFFIFFL